MTDKLNALDKLIEAVEAGRWWDDRGIAAAACNRAGINNANAGRIGRALNGSLDAALALHEALLPGWVFRITGGWPMPLIGDYRIPHVHVFRPRMTEDDEPIGAKSSGVDCGDPARAWLLAILRAYRSVQP